MNAQTYIAKHYRVEILTQKDASHRLDAEYELGWRVVKMAIHADDARIVFLLEKTAEGKS